MNSERKKVSLQDLSLFLDGEASSEKAGLISKALSEDPELKKRYSIYQQQMLELRRLHHYVLDEEIPERLLALIPRNGKDAENW